MRDRMAAVTRLVLLLLLAATAGGCVATAGGGRGACWQEAGRGAGGPAGGAPSLVFFCAESP